MKGFSDINILGTQNNNNNNIGIKGFIDFGILGIGVKGFMDLWICGFMDL